jgi:hypothetical protein
MLCVPELSGVDEKEGETELTDFEKMDSSRRSTQLGEECLGQHLGTPQQADLGDGNGEGTSPSRPGFFPRFLSFPVLPSPTLMIHS